MRRVKNGKTEEETAGRDRGDEAKGERERKTHNRERQRGRCTRKESGKIEKKDT